jgi:hypothetical protein
MDFLYKICKKCEIDKELEQFYAAFLKFISSLQKSLYVLTFFIYLYIISIIHIFAIQTIHNSYMIFLVLMDISDQDYL